MKNPFFKKSSFNSIKVSFLNVSLLTGDVLKTARTQQIGYQFEEYTNGHNFRLRSFRKKKYSQHNTLNLRAYRQNKNYTHSKYLLSLNVCANNIFCNLSYPAFESHNQTIFSLSSGKLNIKVSKKRLKPMLKLYLTSLYKEVKKIIKSKVLLIEIKAPRKLRKKMSKSLYKAFLKDFSLLFNFKHLKSFNGCRPKKFRRKKRKRLVIYK
jgi:hypothetical protein